MTATTEAPKRVADQLGEAAVREPQVLIDSQKLQYSVRSAVEPDAQLRQVGISSLSLDHGQCNEWWMRIANGGRVYRGRDSHPLVRDNLITRIGRWSLRTIVVGYVLSMAGLALLGALALEMWGRHSGDPYSTELRNMTEELLSSGSLLSQDGETAPYYAVVIAASAIAYLSPVFLLGSFVFKLFVRDPIVWRRIITVEDRIGCGAVLVIRFYNASSRALVGMSLNVSAEVETQTTPTSAMTRSLTLSTHSTESTRFLEWASLLPYDPFAAFIPLSGSSQAFVNAADAATSSAIDLQGLVAPKRRVTFTVHLQGTDTVTGSAFVSFKTYRADDIVCGTYQSVYVKPGVGMRRQGQGWRHFEGIVDLGLFVYDDLMDIAVLENMLGGKVTFRYPPQTAVAEGWSRQWASAGSTSQDTAGHEILLARPTIVPESGARCSGRLMPVTPTSLGVLDLRLNEYERVEITNAFSHQADRIVYAYVATLANRKRLEEARSVARAGIARDYVSRLEEAFESLGPHALHELRASMRTAGLPVIRTVVDRDASRRTRRKAFPGHVRRA